MSNSMLLRDYQLSMLRDLYRAWGRKRSVMVQMPTGTGKTVVLAEVIRREMDCGGQAEPRVLVVAHRRELIGQISQTLDRFGIGHVVQGTTEGDGRVCVGSIQKLGSGRGRTLEGSGRGRTRNGSGQTRTDTDEGWQRTDTDGHGLWRAADGDGRGMARTDTDFVPTLVIVDEAHHAMAKTYRKLWERWPRARFLGLTATPCRLGGEPFTELFDVLLQSRPIQEFIDKGWLSDFEYVSAAPDSEALRRVRSLSRRGTDGDYQTAELVTVMDVPESIEHLYRTYRQFAPGKKGIVYAIDRTHAEHIATYYSDKGVRCAVIDCRTPAKERLQIIEDFRRRTAEEELQTSDYRRQAVDVLVNVDVFSEGFDVPQMEFIQLARPTLSLAKYLQQVGRGMRACAGKPHVLILDNVGLYQTFGLPTEERDWRQMFHGLKRGKGCTADGHCVVLDEPEAASPLQRELVNLQMVRIKKGGQKRAGLEIFLKDGQYGVMNNGRVSCRPRFKEIVRLHDRGGYFAAGIYGGSLFGHYVEYASLIDRKGLDLGLRLFRDVEWRDGVYYSSYRPRGYRDGDCFWAVYWDPKGNCYYDDDPAFRTVAGVEVAEACEHDDRRLLCYKLRYSTGSISPRFNLGDMFFNSSVIIARDYLVVKNDRNHAYHICGYFGNSVIVRKEDMSGYMQIGLDGKKGASYRSLPQGTRRISPVSCLYYTNELGLRKLRINTPE